MSLVQWPRAKYWEKSWNPVIGCLPCSPACAHCYARAWAKRFGQSFEPHAAKGRIDRRGIWHWPAPPRHGTVFAGNMTDLFGEWLSPSSSAQIVALAADTPGDQATYLWLTKRPRRMADCLSGFLPSSFRGNGWLENHFFGFTAEDQKRFSQRLHNALYFMPTWVNKWVSCEPLLGPVDFGFSPVRIAAAHSFPADYVLAGTRTDQVRQIGNSVPVRTAEAMCLADLEGVA